MKIKLLLLVVVSFTLFADLSGQKPNKKITITGRVVDYYSSPVSGAIIMIDGKNSDRRTNDKGHYKIRVNASVTKIGIFTTSSGVKEEPVNGRISINFNLDKFVPGQTDNNPNVSNSDAVDAGYSTVSKRNATKPVNRSVVNEKNYGSYRSIYELIQTLPGVTVIDNTVTVRGMQTSGNSSPLFVVNGTVVSSIAGIDPGMVKSIDVLKGPSASIYGLQGANGVIMINLK